MNLLKKIRYGQTFQDVLNEIDALATELTAWSWRITEPFNGTTCTVEMFLTADDTDRMETWMIVAAFDGTLHRVEIGD